MSMKATCWCLGVVVTLTAALPLAAGELGDKAQPLSIKEWVKGQPVDVTKADGKHVYVVEFWATWCPPCLTSIPHLSELQKKYKDKNVTFVGVSVDGEETVGKVKPFIEKMGDKMDYTVVIDKEGATARAYMGAFGITGIPHAFVVDQKGRIIWHDNPHPAQSNLAEVIDKVLEGKFDVVAARKLMAKREEEARQRTLLVQDVQEYFRLVLSPQNKDRAADLGRKILTRGREDGLLMNQFAWMILTEDGIAVRDLKLALEAAEAAFKSSKGEDANILDTYALALFENGRKTDAIKYQKKAVELAEKEQSHPPQMLADLKERLERFQKESK
jgi:thiol-disulfide isomerase/thioredoxin